VNISEAVTQPEIVSAPKAAPWAPPRLPHPKHRRWAIPCAGLGLGLGAAILGSSVVFVDRYAEAPGKTSEVESRLQFDAVERFKADGRIFFVTVAGPHLTGLQALIGWLDPDVDQLTYAERFPNTTPEQDRSLNLRAMRSSKDDAPYVALTKLGYPTERSEGAVIVDQVLCAEAAADGRRCETPVPADVFLDSGDEILAIAGTPISVRADIAEALSEYAPGDTVEFTVRRAAPNPDDLGAEQTGEVELIANPEDETRPFIGIQLADSTQVKLPFPIDIDTGAIGGPSAGLAFTLTLLDELTPGELTGGKRVAATGTIDIDGNVGPIGGLHQKAVAVEQLGVDLFLVPAGQSPEALADAVEVLGADRVVAVETIDDALAALAAAGGNALELGRPGEAYTG
jgi:PDZ domain-containing protein